MTAASANAPDTTVTVDVSQTGKVPTRAGAGFLYGLSQDGSGPVDSLMQPLAPTLFRGGGAGLPGEGWVGDGYTAGPGYRARIASGIAQARRVTAAPYKGRYDLLVSDVWGAGSSQPANTVEPCTNGDCSNYKAFIDQVVADVQASGVTVAYDIWNEPDGTSFWQAGVNSTQYYQMWDTAVREIRRLSPSATVVGPSYSGYNHSWLDGFLGQTKADNTLPTVLNWHFGTDPAADAADAAALVSAHGLSPMPLSINEYLFSGQQTAGYTAWFLDRLAVSNVGAAAHAIWNYCCMIPSLDSILGGTGDLAAPTGQWWTYRAYAALTGHLVTATSGNAAIAVAASADQGAGQADVLIGNNSGQTGTTTVTVTGLGATPWLTAGSTVHATLMRIPDSTPLSRPITVSDTDATVTNGSISLPATFQAGTDAFWLVLSPHGVSVTGPGGSGGTSGPGSGQVVVDGNEIGTAPDQWQYDSAWGLTAGVPDMYAGTANHSVSAGAAATFTFTGTQVAVHAVHDVDQGIMTIAVDGGTPTTVDNYAFSRNASGTVWTSPVLAAGLHTVRIVNTGNRNGASSGTNIAIDRADVTPSAAQIVVDGNTTGTNNNQFSYGANWGLTTGVPDMYQGTANWSHTAGATGTFRFTGTRVALHAVRDVDQAVMTVAVDGGTPTSVDNYAPARNASGVVWTSPTLAAGAHTITIVNTGNRNSASSGINIAIDRADVTS
ncbi:RICIN domain-containing protein [Catenulispora yoronensis]|uniref:RICIN domain-containing protein n=1 Tax=Catenulispora yoronensis TaxID=450799 RepID=A0ABP5F5L2_9ACTN